jgi:hypothetical protein
LCQSGWRISTPDNLPLDKVSSEGALQMLAIIPPQADVGELAALKATVAATASELQVGGGCRAEVGRVVCKWSIRYAWRAAATLSVTALAFVDLRCIPSRSPAPAVIDVYNAERRLNCCANLQT